MLIPGVSESLAIWAGVVLGFCGVAGVGRAQETVRMSLASADAAVARRKAATTADYYNLKLGLAAWRFGAGLGLEYNDNVRYQDSTREGDFIFRPNFTTQMLLPVSDQNSINLRVSAGYSAYVEHTELSQFYVAPGSEVAFDIYVGDFWINLHDRFSISQSGYQDPTVAATGDFAALENAAGVTGLWDLNRANLRLNYDHGNYISLGGQSTSQPDRASEVFSASLGYKPKAEMELGIEAGGSLVEYVESGGAWMGYTSAVQWNMGGFYHARVSDYIRVRASAGYTMFSPEADAVSEETFEGEADLSGLYADLQLRHVVNQHVDYTVSGGREISYAFYGGTADVYFARLSANWRLLQKITLTTSVDYDTGTQYEAAQVEDFKRIGGGITLSRGITEKLIGSLGYRYYVRDSDLPERSYGANIVTVNFNYGF